MTNTDSSTPAATAKTPKALDEALFPVEDVSVQRIFRHVQASRSALSDSERRALIYRIGRRRVDTRWVR